MAKNNRYGQAAIITENEALRIRNALSLPWQKLFWDIARYTGERWGAITALQVRDVYLDPKSRKPHEYITYRAATRKANPDGSHQTRQVPIHPVLIDILKAYEPPLDGWLFPSRNKPENHICFIAADMMLRRALLKAGLDRKGISTHSTRRTFITNLHRKGIDIHTLRRITGHKSFEMLSRYIEADPERVKAAIAIL